MVVQPVAVVVETMLVLFGGAGRLVQRWTAIRMVREMVGLGVVTRARRSPVASGRGSHGCRLEKDLREKGGRGGRESFGYFPNGEVSGVCGWL